MDVDQSDYEFLKSAALRSSADLRRTIRGVDVERTARGAHVVQHVLEALDGIEQQIANLDELASIPGGGSHAHLVGGMRLLNDQVRAVHAAIPWVEGLRRSSLPLGLAYFVEEASLALGLNVDFLLHPDPIYMYSTDVAPFESWAPVAEDRPTPVIISFPAREAQSLFLNMIFVHELGHLAVTDGILDAVLTAHPIDFSGDLAKEAVDWYADHRFRQLVDDVDPGDPVLAARRIAFHEQGELQLRSSARDWVEESLCDAVALAYLGPSYILASADFLYSATIEGSARAHPPVPLRIRTMLKAPDDPGWNELMSRYAPNAWTWLRSLAERTWAGDPFEKFAGEYVVAASETIHELVRERLGEHIFTPSAYASVHDELSEMLAHGILPVQLDHELAIGAPHIILGGWLDAFSRSGDTPESVASALANRRHQAFLTKAIEMSSLATRWEEVAEHAATTP